MKSSYLFSSILKGIWAIDAVSAEGYYPLVFNLLMGKLNLPENQKNSEIKTASFGRDTAFINEDEKDSFVRVLQYKDVVVKYDQNCGPSGTETLSAAIKLAAADPQVAAIVLDLDTPGGEGGACQLPSQAIQDAKKVKPVIAYVGNGMCASAGYYIASNADEIYATFETDEIGSIGTYVTIADFKAYYESQGLKIEDIYATKSTNKNKAFRLAINGKYDELRKNYIDPFNEVFLNTVMENRGIAFDSEALTGKLYYAKDAMNVGLIDGMMSFDKVIERAFELADNKTGNNNNNHKNSNKMFGKTRFKALAAFADTSADERTPEQLDAVNQELEANGIGGFLMEATEDLSSAADVEQALAAASNSVNIAIEERDALQAGITETQSALTTATESLTVANARIEELEAESAGVSRQEPKKTDPKKSGDSDQEVIDNLPHNQHADEILIP